MQEPEGWEGRYQTTLYHDEPDNANTDSLTLPRTGAYSTEEEAVEAANYHAMNAYWNGGASIHRGTWYGAIPGVRPERFEDDENVTPKYVYDGIVQ